MNKNNRISENWKNAGETIEVVELSGGSNITVFITGQYAIIFQSIYDFHNYEFFGGEIKRIYCSTADLEDIYNLCTSFHTIPIQEEHLTSSGKNYKKLSK